MENKSYGDRFQDEHNLKTNNMKQEELENVYKQTGVVYYKSKLDIEQLQFKVLQWADDRNLLKKENVLKQFAKFISEAGELGDAIIKEQEFETRDAIGDVQVTLILLAKQLGYDYNECLESAYNEIANRKGKTVNGTFIKD